MYRLNVVARLFDDDRFIMSEGRCELLEHIRETASLAESAKRMGMSYRHAWGVLKRLNEAAGEKVALSERGGGTGGRTVLTPKGRELLYEYGRRVKALGDFMAGVERDSPALTVDAVLFHGGKLVLVKRKNPPFEGEFALPGGFVERGETCEEAVLREVREECGLDCDIKALVGVYSDPDRDPRGHTVTVCYLLESTGGIPAAGDDASEAVLFEPGDLPPMAFDHGMIVRDALETTR